MTFLSILVLLVAFACCNQCYKILFGFNSLRKEQLGNLGYYPLNKINYIVQKTIIPYDSYIKQFNLLPIVQEILPDSFNLTGNILNSFLKTLNKPSEGLLGIVPSFKPHQVFETKKRFLIKLFMNLMPIPEPELEDFYKYILVSPQDDKFEEYFKGKFQGSLWKYFNFKWLILHWELFIVNINFLDNRKTEKLFNIKFDFNEGPSLADTVIAKYLAIYKTDAKEKIFNVFNFLHSSGRICTFYYFFSFLQNLSAFSRNNPVLMEELELEHLSYLNLASKYSKEVLKYRILQQHIRLNFWSCAFEGEEEILTTDLSLAKRYPFCTLFEEIYFYKVPLEQSILKQVHKLADYNYKGGYIVRYYTQNKDHTKGLIIYFTMDKLDQKFIDGFLKSLRNCALKFECHVSNIPS